jgi:hypothetical protein
MIFRSEMETVGALKRIYTLSKRMARTVKPEVTAAQLDARAESA